MRHARSVLRSSVCVINDTDSRKLGVLGCVAATYSVKQTNLWFPPPKKKRKKNKTAGRHQNPADSAAFYHNGG